jgi:hypothetical protein
LHVRDLDMVACCAMHIPVCGSLYIKGWLNRNELYKSSGEENPWHAKEILR